MIRPFLSLKRLSFSEKGGQVNYQYAKEMPEKERMDYMEFIARVTSHIPDKNQVMVRYYGLSIPMPTEVRSARKKAIRPIFR